jgi:hypothetical protein
MKKEYDFSKLDELKNPYPDKKGSGNQLESSSYRLL